MKKTQVLSVLCAILAAAFYALAIMLAGTVFASADTFKSQSRDAELRI